MKRTSYVPHINACLRCFLFSVIITFAVLPFTSYAEDLSPEIRSVIDDFMKQHVAFCGGDAYTMVIEPAPGDPVHKITGYRFRDFHWKATIVQPTAAEQLNGVEERFQLDMSAGAYREYIDMKGTYGFTSPLKGWKDWKDWNDPSSGGTDISVQIDKHNGAWVFLRLNVWAEDAIGETAPSCDQIKVWLGVRFGVPRLSETFHPY